MKLEKLEDEQSGQLLLLFSDGDAAQAEALKSAFLNMGDEPIAVHLLGMIEAPDDCELFATRSTRNRGVRQTSPRRFTWEMTADGWIQVAELLDPFIASSTGFQWLTNQGVEVIYSPTGRW